MKIPQRLAIALSLVLLFYWTTNAQEKGSIRGTVVDEAGAPVAGAKVNASPLGGWRIIRAIRYVSTDAEGRFLIDGLEFGRYAVFAMKEEASYPNMSSSFYSNNVFPSAVIAPSSPSQELQIQLGPKAGAITGSITNSVNGAPINAGFQLTRAASPDKWLGTSAPPNYRILLPSSTDVLIEVSAPGFKNWTAPSPLRLQPGSELHLNISLEPAHDATLHPSKFLVPEGYIGWLLLEYNVKDAELSPIEVGVKVFKFPPNGQLSTSSPGPERGADDEFFYYSADSSLRQIPGDYVNGKGMIWGIHEGTKNGALSQFGFFVGSEEQYKKHQSQGTHPGPISIP